MDSDTSSGEDIFECGRCGKRFVDYGLFKAHKKDRVCKGREAKTNENNQRLDVVGGGSIENSLSTISMELQCHDTSLYNKDELVTGTNSNDVELPLELTSITDIENDPSKVTTRNKSQLVDHDYNIFLQTQIDIETNTQTDRHTETCMLCSVVTTSLHDHLINQHMIAEDKIVEFVSLYTEDASCKMLNKPDRKTENTCNGCHTVFKTSSGLQKHVCKKRIRDNSSSKFKNEISLEKHVSSEYTCQDCECSFTNFDSSMKHVCSKSGRAFCSKCKVQFLNSAHKQNHKCFNFVGETKNFKTRTRRCSLCEFSSVHSGRLLSHFREQHMNDNEIDENVNNSDADEETQKRSDNNEKVKCKRCKHSLFENNLEKHRLMCHNGKGRTCILCKHYARDTHDYIIHVDTHKVWLDLEGIKKAKETEQVDISAENQSVFQDTDENPKQMDCSKLRLTDLDKLANKISKEQHLVNSEDENVISGTSQNEDVTSHDKNGKSGDNSQRSHRNIMTRKCKSCGKYVMANSLNHHMLVTHNKIKLFRCFLESCAKVYIGIEQFNEHAKSHPENEDMLWCGCKTCVQFHPSGVDKRKELRKKTMRQYYQKMMYKCEKCWCKFPTEAGLNKHKTNESHNYPCHVCGKIQVSVRQLKIHILTHDDSRPYLCDVCGLGYKTSRDLRKHHLNHSDVRPFVCETCGKAFTTKLKLNRHNLCVHNPVKRFECTHDGCEKKFSRKDKLKDHLNTHLEVEPFKCPYCNKGFSRPDNLRDHEVLHTRDYRFKCDMCSKGYMRPKLLEVHKQREHVDQCKQSKQQDTFPLYTLYSQQPIQILPEAIQTLTSETVQQLQQVVNISDPQQQTSLDAQYQQALVNTAVPNITVFDSL